MSYVVPIVSKDLNNECDNFGSVLDDHNKEPRGKCSSNENLNDGRYHATQRRDFLRAASWTSGDGEKPEPGKDGKSLINRSVSQKLSHKKSKKKSTGKRFINSVFNTIRRKKSTDLSRNRENSGTAASLYSEAATQSCENESPLNDTETERTSLTGTLSSGEFRVSMEGNVQCMSNCSFCVRLHLIPIISMLNSPFSGGRGRGGAMLSYIT